MQCGAQSSEAHDRLVSGAARCLASNCGKPAVKRDRLADERRAAAQRESERAADERQASAAKMEAETEGYTRPVKYAPTPAPPVMRERDRLEIRAFNEQEAAEQRAADAPRLEAERRNAERVAVLQSEHQNTLRQLRSLERERVSTGEDDAFQVDPDTVGPNNGIKPDQVASWQAAQFTTFISNNPGYYRCDENGAAISDYLERNCPGLKLISAKQLEAAYKRLSEFGLLKERPAPTPKPAPVQSKPAPAEPKKPKAELIDGWDITSGEPRKWTPRELDRLSSTDYRRALRLYKEDLALPSVGPSGMRL